MLKLKTLISIMAALVVTFAAAAAGGAFQSLGWTPSPGLVGIIQAAAMGVAILGVSPYQFKPPVPAYLTAAGVFMAAVQAYHAGSARAQHSAFWVVFGVAGVVVSMLGKSPLPHPSAAAQLDVPPKI